MTEQEIYLLIEKARQGELTPEEQDKIAKNYHQNLKKMNLLLKKFTALVQEYNGIRKIKNTLS